MANAPGGPTASTPGAQASNVAARFLELTEAPYNLSPDQAASTNAINLQTAVDVAYAANLRLTLKGDAAGRAIPLDRAIYFTQASISGGTGGDAGEQGGGGASTRLYANSIQGRLVNGNRPKFKLEDGATLSNMEDVTPLASGAVDENQYYCMFWFRWKDDAVALPTTPWNNSQFRLYAATWRNIDIDIGDNPSVTGMYFAGAQACFLSDTDIDASQGFAGLFNIPGSGASTVNVNITGGSYGLIVEDYTPTPHMNVCNFIGQTIAGVVYFDGPRNGIFFNGCKWTGSSSTYNAISGPQTTQLETGTQTNNNTEGFTGLGAFLTSCSIEMTGDASARTAIDMYDGNVALFDSWVKAAEIVHTAKRDSPNTTLTGVENEWRFIKGWAQAGVRVGGSLWVDGVETVPSSNNEDWLWEPLRPGTPPTSYVDPFSWTEAEIIHQFDDTSLIEPTLVLNDNTANNAPAINAALALGDVKLPGGFIFVAEPVIVPVGRKLVGVGQSQSILHAARNWTPGAETAVLRTAEGESATTYLQAFGISMYEAKGGLSGINLEPQKNIIGLDVRSKVKIFEVQVCRYEFYGSGNTPIRKSPLIRFSAKASGQVHSISADQVPSSGGVTIEGSFSQVEFRDRTATERLYVFDLNIEGSGGDQQAYVENFPDLFISPLKTEADVNLPAPQPALRAVNSNGLIIAGMSGRNSTISLSDDSLIDLTGCRGTLAFGLSRTLGTDGGTKYFHQINT